MNILLTGGTGLIGKELGKQLVLEGHKIWVLSRSGEKSRSKLPFPCTIIEGDLSQSPLQIAELDKIEAVIHLAGESIQGRWTEEKKDAIWHSRVEGTKNLVESLKSAKKLKSFIAASATGFYGDRGDEELVETSEAGEDFLASVTKNWEQSSFSIKDIHPSVRVVCLRTGMVLSRSGGALEKLIPIFENGLGASLGSGRQWMSWIHIQDLVSIYKGALTDTSLSGAVNAVSPNPALNKDFTQAMAQSLGKRSLPVNVPEVALEIGLGEMKQVVTSSQRVFPKTLLAMGFEFEFASLTQALDHLLAIRKQGELELWQEQFVPADINRVFGFFSSEKNLEKITPQSMSFHVLDKSTDQIQEGTQIQYQLKLRGLPLKWTSVIENWQPNKVFVDRQIKGPYKSWVHTHSFEEIEGGVLITDHVRYRLPAGSLGRLFGGALVKRELNRIFSYRRSVIAKEFAN